MKLRTILALGAAALVGLTLPAAAQQRLTMGATLSASSFYAYQVAVANFLNNALKNANINVRELGGAEVSTEALLRGEVDMGIAVTSSDYAAMKGNKPFGQPATKLRTLYYFAPLPLNFVVSQESGINSLDGLDGKRFNPGGRGTATESQATTVLHELGIKPDLVQAEGNDALEAYQNRNIVGFVKAGLHPDGYIQQANAARPVSFLSLTDAQIQKIVASEPYFSAASIDLGDHYGGGKGTEKTVQTAIGINTTSDLDEDTAYRIAKAVFSKAGQEAAAAAYPPAARTDPIDLTLSAAVAPLHPGVIKYLKEIGKTIPDRLIPHD